MFLADGFSFTALGAVRDALTESDPIMLQAARSQSVVAMWASLVAAAVGLIGGAVGVAGVALLRRGSLVFGAEHAAAVRRGAALAAASGALFVAAGVEMLFEASNLESFTSASDLANAPVALDRLYFGLFVTATFVLLGSLVAGLALNQFLQHLMTSAGRSRQTTFLSLLLAGPTLKLLIATAVPAMIGPVSFVAGGANAVGLLESLGRMLGAFSLLAVGGMVGSFLTVLALAGYRSMIRSAARGATNLLEGLPLDPPPTPALG